MYGTKPFTKKQIVNLCVKTQMRPFSNPPVYVYTLFMGRGLTLSYHSHFKEVHVWNTRNECFYLEICHTLDEFVNYAVSLMNFNNDNFNYLDYV